MMLRVLVLVRCCCGFFFSPPLQVFYVVPRINQIDEAWQQINRVVPDARVAVGHSKVQRA